MSIDHVVVLALENRSFDHMLGYVPHPDPSFDGLAGAAHANPGWQGVGAVAVSPDAKTVMPICPDHSHDAVMEQLGLSVYTPGATPTNEGFVSSYERIGRGLDPPSFGGVVGLILNRLKSNKAPSNPIVGRGPLVMRCQAPSQVPVLAALATQFAVFTRWFCSVPGETWPNRNFLHAATSDGETDIDPRMYTNKTIFELLEENGADWHIYYDDTPQVWAFVHLWDTDERHAKWFEYSAFAKHVAAGTLPSYSFIEPNHRPVMHTLDHDPVIGSPDVSTSQHPGNNVVSDSAYDCYDDSTPDDFKRAEGLVAGIYETLRSNPDLFARTLLLITYDEHGGLYDHVAPPTGVPNPGFDTSLLRRIMRAIYHRKATAFDFSMLGPRVPTVAVSPLIDPATVIGEVFDHASVPATLRALFAPNAKPLTSRDGWAKPFHTVARRDNPRTDLPDLSAHVAAPVSAPATSAGLGVATPIHYEPFVALADSVRDTLARTGTAEAAAIPGTPAMERTLQTTAVFAAKANRIRSGG